MRTREQLERSAKLRRLAQWIEEEQEREEDPEFEFDFGAEDVMDALRELEALRDENQRLRRS